MRIQWHKFNKTYTMERLIQELKALGENLGRAPMGSDIRSGSKQGKCPSLSTYQAEFGTFTQALEAAGFEVVKRRGKARVFTQDELLKEIISLRLKLGRRVDKDDVKMAHRKSKFPSVETLRTHFGSADLALLKAEKAFLAGPD